MSRAYFSKKAYVRRCGAGAEEPSRVRPADAVARRMGVEFVVGMHVVQPVVGDPPRRRVLEGTEGERGERTLEPAWHREAAVREQAVVAEIDAERAEHVRADERENDPRPAEAPRQKGEAGEQVHAADRQHVLPVHASDAWRTDDGGFHADSLLRCGPGPDA